jgi:hypothetical protein
MNKEDNFGFFCEEDVEMCIPTNEHIELTPTQKIRKSKSYPSPIEIFNVMGTPITDNTINIINRLSPKNIKINVYSKECLNRLLSIFLHITIMISFEIMFYFKYIINVERDEILSKLNSYINSVTLDQNQELMLQSFLNAESFQTFYDNLYYEYKQSMHEQHQQQIELLQQSITYASAFYGSFIVILSYSIYNKKHVKWYWIVSENVIMFVLLGIFEYVFFTQIIMNYNPLTDDEIKYYVTRDIYEKFG